MKKIKITEKQARLLETLNSKKVLKVTKEQYNRIIESELYNKPSFTETSEIREEEMNEDLFREFVNELYGMNEEGKELKFEKVCKLMEAAGLIESGKIVKEKFENNTKNVKSVIGKGLKMYEECGSAYKAVEMMEEALTRDEPSIGSPAYNSRQDTINQFGYDPEKGKYGSQIEPLINNIRAIADTNEEALPIIKDFLKIRSASKVSNLRQHDLEELLSNLKSELINTNPNQQSFKLDEREDLGRVHIDKEKLTKDIKQFGDLIKVGHWDNFGLINWINSPRNENFTKDFVEKVIEQMNAVLIKMKNLSPKSDIQLKELSDYTYEPFKTTDIKRNDNDLSKYNINPSEYGPLDEFDSTMVGGSYEGPLKHKPAFKSNVGSTAPIKPLFTEEDELSEARYKGDTYYSRGEWFSRSDDKQSLSKKTKPEWDIFVDKYNSMPGFETKTTADGRTYRAEIKNLESGLSWVVQNSGNNNWSYIGRKVGYTGNPEFLRDVQALIANFEEINGNNEEGLNEYGLTDKIYESLKKK